MTAVPEGGERQIAPRRRDRDVEHHVRPGRIEHRIEVAADGDIVEPELLGPRFGASDVQIHQAGNRHAVDLTSGLEPRFAHGTASDQDGLHHPERSSRAISSCRRHGPARFP